MSRQQQIEGDAPRRWRTITGLILVGLGLLLLMALFTYDRADLEMNRSPAHAQVENWTGRIGARVADSCFKWWGASGYLLPVVLLVTGASCLSLYLRWWWRRWPWAAVLLVVSLALLDLYTDQRVLERLGKELPVRNAGLLERLAFNLSAPSAGGVLGLALNEYLFRHFGRLGSTILCLTLYLISLYGLTDFHIGDWWRQRRQAQTARATEGVDEASLERRAKELEKEEKRLRQQLEKANREPTAPPSPPPPATPPPPGGLGADLQPVPEPRVRDLSVPQAVVTPPSAAPPPPPAPAGPRPAPVAEPAVVPEPVVRDVSVAPAPSAPPPPPAEPEVRVEPAPEPPPQLPPRELGPATTAEVLGAAAARTTAPAAEEPAALPAPEPIEEPVESGGEPGEELLPVVEPPPPGPPPPPTPAPAPRPKPVSRKPKPLAVATPPLIGNYQLPALELLHPPDLTLKPTESKEELMANARLMQQTLAQFDIQVALGDITKGPTITRYELHPAPGVKLEKITALTNNIAAALKAERINILAPVPGKSSVGVEVPNAIKSKVILRELLESDQWGHSKARIPLALGKDVYGNVIIGDLGEMPHLLIAGSTGSGKSVCVNSIVASLLYRFSPDQLRFVMIDPKVVELQQYNALPHLVVPVVTDPKKVILALRWVVNEMEKRYQIFARVGVRNIRSFNERPKDRPLPKREPELPLTAKRERVEAGADGFAVEVDEAIVVPREEDILIPEKLSYIVVIIDELADLMLVAPADVEMAIARITQMARAAGIHCIVATQRPSVDVITGVIKANIPCRIAFQVAAKVDSRTILDAMGADKLLGQGDMLYLPPGSARLIRAQGALITDQELERVVEFIARQAKPSYELDIHQQLSKPSANFDDEEGTDEDEALIEQCIEVIRSEQKASVSLLQRRLRLGYTRAARIMDELENRGIVGPSKGAEPRDILIDLDGAGAEGQPPGAGPV